MTPKQLIAAGIKLHGEWGWQTRLADRLGVHVTTIQRYVAGQVPIPGPVEAAVRCFLEQSKEKQ